MENQSNQSKSGASVVLVHGAFVDGSGWESVYNILQKEGYNVAVVQNPTISLAGDVAATKQVIAAMDVPVILVGHSYGGVVITEAGNDPKVEALVYIDAFAPDKDESVSSLIKDPPPEAPIPPLLPPQNGFVTLDKSKFAAAFAADVDKDKAKFMADSQTPWGLEAINGKIKEPAWKNKPSWYLVGTEDRMIPADFQHFMANRAGSIVLEVKGASHSVFLSQPAKVAEFIKEVVTNYSSAEHVLK
jgi:pimeloyl-ACP methyl ester carboxylesterase